MILTVVLLNYIAQIKTTKRNDFKLLTLFDFLNQINVNKKLMDFSQKTNQ